MNLSENLKKIRKDNNLSQEALAEKLGVSRQSVSKWESGLAYPEMDKVIQICNMFNVNIDELLNQNIKEVEKTKQSKININKYIDDFLNYITRIVKMFGSMKFFDIVKCIVEQVFIILVLLFVKSLIGELFAYPVRKILSIFPNSVENVLFDIISSIFELGMIALIVVIVLHIFKIRYLDYYVIEKKEIDEEAKEELTEENIKISKKEEPKVIIRDPKHTGESFISFIAKCIIFIIKIFVLGFGMFFCFSLISFSVLLVLSFLFVKTGLLFLGGLLGLIGCITINLIILYMILYFVFDRKINFKFVFTPFLASLIIGGIGIGLILIGIKDFNYLNEYNEKYMIKEESVVRMSDELFFTNNSSQIEYIETDSKDVKIIFEHPKTCRVDDADKYFYVNCVEEYLGSSEFINYYLDALNDKVFINPDYFKIKIYTSKDNIEKIKNNREKFFHSN